VEKSIKKQIPRLATLARNDVFYKAKTNIGRMKTEDGRRQAKEGCKSLYGRELGSEEGGWRAYVSDF
jgi:hypothetical protein